MIKRKSPWEAIHDGDDGDEETLQEEDSQMTAKIFADLQDARQSVRGEVMVEHFRIGPLGGAWTLRMHCILYGVHKAWASGADVCSLRDAYKLRKSSRFNASL